MKRALITVGDVVVVILFFGALMGLVALMCQMAWKGMPR